MTQNFFVSAEQTGRPGVYVPLETTINDVKDIIEGKYDELTEDKFLLSEGPPKHCKNSI